MATFKATIKKDKMRADKTWNVLIRFTHNCKVRYIPTTMYVTKKDMTASMKLKNQQIIDKCDMLISTYRKNISALNLELNDMDIDAVIDYLHKLKNNNTSISFTSYIEKWTMLHKDIKGLRNYHTACNSLKNFFGRDTILHTDITVRNLNAFSEYLADKPRAQSLYTSAIVRIFNDMKDYYNDEDNGIVRIKHSLRKFTVPNQNIAQKRALSVDNIRTIFSLPYDGVKVKGMSSRHDLALDCFRLSFGLMGINSADLFNAMEFDGECIIYNRTKTKDRRTDNARMIVKVHPAIRPIFDKYRGKERVFNFHERFSTMSDLNRAINKGLKEVGKEIGVEHLQFYAARHSMATIAINKVGINKYIVNDMLCHTDPSMRITDLYIEKDFTPINETNFQLLSYIFDDKNE